MTGSASASMDASCGWSPAPVGESPLVQKTRLGFETLLARSTELVMAEMLILMVELVGLTPTLAEVRLLAVWFLAFAGFMCCDELLKLLCKDIVFNKEGNIRSSKIDQLRDCAYLVLDSCITTLLWIFVGGRVYCYAFPPLPPCPEDIQFFGHKVRIRLRGSKTDQWRKGALLNQLEQRHIWRAPMIEGWNTLV